MLIVQQTHLSVQLLARAHSQLLHLKVEQCQGLATRGALSSMRSNIISYHFAAVWKYSGNSTACGTPSCEISVQIGTKRQLRHALSWSYSSPVQFSMHCSWTLALCPALGPNSLKRDDLLGQASKSVHAKGDAT